MLTWLSVLSCLVATSVAFIAPASNAPNAMARASPAYPSLILADFEEIASLELPVRWAQLGRGLTSILEKLEFANLSQLSLVAKGFHGLVCQVIRAGYYFVHNEKLYLKSTLILDELKALVQDVVVYYGAAEANGKLSGSPFFRCMQFVLEAQFGYCIEFADGHSPQFRLEDDNFCIPHDTRKASALPYILDQQRTNFAWLFTIRRLVEDGRLDLLAQLKFSKIDASSFSELMGVPLPEPVLATAFKSLQKNERYSELVNLYALAKFGNQTSILPVNCKVPLFLLDSLSERRIPFPKSYVITMGLADSAIRFWTSLIEKNPRETKDLLELIMLHGDDETKLLARVFNDSVYAAELESHYSDVFRAVLIRLCFSPICNGHIFQNYEMMLSEPLKLRYHTACAFLDCEEYGLLSEVKLCNVSNSALELLAHRIYRLQEPSLLRLVHKFYKHRSGTPKLLKSLVREGEDSGFIEFIWNAITKSESAPCIAKHCCSAPLDALKGLLLDSHISVVEVQKMLCMLDGFQMFGQRFPTEVHVLYTIMFWEAPEDVIDHFLGLVLDGFKLDEFLVGELLRLTKYSKIFCLKLIQHCEKIDLFAWQRVQKLRPDLDVKLDQKLMK